MFTNESANRKAAYGATRMGSTEGKDAHVTGRVLFEG